jgi:site-specific recombinase XerD
MKIKQILRDLDRASKWRKQIDRLDGAYADSTLRAYRTDVHNFVIWCEEKNYKPFPTTPEMMSQYIDHCSEIYSASTIKRRLAAIGKIHRLMKLGNPTSDEEVKLAIRRALRKKLTRPCQALGLTAKLRDQLIACCDHSLIGKRDRALIAVGYDTLSRRSELISIWLDDLILSTKGARILIKRAKNDPFGRGRMSHLSPKTTKYLQDWIKVSGITEGPLFRGIKHGKIHSQCLHPYSVNRIIKKTALSAGLTKQEIQKLSGHSMRVGAAQDMMVAGMDILPIMAAGGWKTTNVVARYIENTDLSPVLHQFFERPI